MKETKYVAITGASSGIGRDLAIEVAKKGDTPILIARTQKALIELQKEIKKEYKIESFVFPCDISKKNERTNLIKDIFTNIPRIDVFVNNAGFGIFEEVENSSYENIQEMFDVNVVGLFDLTRLVVPYMIKEGKGHIINVASVAGIMPTPKSSVYAATKHAVLGFTNALRMEVKDKGIFVTAFNPGPVSSPFHARADVTGEYEKSIGNWMVSSQDVAKKISKVIEKPKREVFFPWYMGTGGKLYQIAPSLVEKIAGPFLFKK